MPLANPKVAGLFVGSALLAHQASSNPGFGVGLVEAGDNVVSSIGQKIKNGVLGAVAGLSSLLPGIQAGESSELERERRRLLGEQVQEEVLQDADRPKQEPPERDPPEGRN